MAGSVRTAEVAIVGGGVIGCSIAWSLARAGVRNLLLFERESLAAGATGVCPGGIRLQFSTESDCRLALRSHRFWNRINEILEPEHPFVFEKSGYLFLAHSEALLRKFQDNVAMQNRLGIPSQILDPEDLRRLLPKLDFAGVHGGSFCAEDGFVEDCHGVTHSLARGAAQRGALIVYRRVDGLERLSDTWRLRAGGDVFEARHVVLAAGAETRRLAGQAGVAVPLRRERRRLAFTEAFPENLMPPLVVAPELGFAGKQLSYGVFYLGWLAERESDEELAFLENALGGGSRLLPLLAELPVRRVLSGDYDNSPDARPILGRVPGVEGLHLAAGFSGHGYMIAPAVGELVTGEILGLDPGLPTRPFSIARFAESVESEDLVI